MINYGLKIKKRVSWVKDFNLSLKCTDVNQTSQIYEINLIFIKDRKFHEDTSGIRFRFPFYDKFTDETTFSWVLLSWKSTHGLI